MYPKEFSLLTHDNATEEEERNNHDNPGVVEG